MGNMINKCPLCGKDDLKNVLSQKELFGNDTTVFEIVECLNCSLLFVKNRPSKKELGKYYDKNYQPFESKYNWISEKFIDWRTKNELKEFFAHNDKIKDILDIGCSNGAYLKRLANNGDFDSLVGIDMSEETILKSRNTEKLELRSGDFLDIEFNDDSFDLIVMNHLIEHVYEPSLVLSKVNRMLRPGGLLLIKTPNYKTVERRIFGKSWFPYEIPRHIFIFSLKSIHRLLKDNGFKVLETKYEKTPNNIILSMCNYLKIKNSKFEKYFSINNYLLLILILPISILLGYLKQSGRIVLLAQKNK